MAHTTSTSGWALLGPRSNRPLKQVAGAHLTCARGRHTERLDLALQVFGIRLQQQVAEGKLGADPAGGSSHQPGQLGGQCRSVELQQSKQAAAGLGPPWRLLPAPPPCHPAAHPPQGRTDLDCVTRKYSNDEKTWLEPPITYRLQQLCRTDFWQQPADKQTAPSAPQRVWLAGHVDGDVVVRGLVHVELAACGSPAACSERSMQNGGELVARLEQSAAQAGWPGGDSASLSVFRPA